MVGAMLLMSLAPRIYIYFDFFITVSSESQNVLSLHILMIVQLINLRLRN